MSDAIPEIDLYTDGACKGNPGNGGWACILKAQDGTETVLSGGMPDTTNNQMELMAVIQGLQSLESSCLVRVHSDSTYVLKGLEEWLENWKKKGWKTANKKPVKNQELWKLLDALKTKHTLEFNWIRGHNGHPENERCDELAVEESNLVGR
tara:strand:+ start:66302 stop:66754 length:453 start_codon:yes stop_codon:yes gene_type:complete